jgi:hypothetical protein
MWSSLLPRYTKGDYKGIYFIFFKLYFIFYVFLKFTQISKNLKRKRVGKNEKGMNSAWAELGPRPCDGGTTHGRKRLA